MKKIVIVIVLLFAIAFGSNVFFSAIQQPPKGLKGKIIFKGSIDINRKERAAIGIYDLEEGKETVIPTEEVVFDPSMSPDGKKIIYQLSEDENIYIINSDGTNKRIFLDSDNNKYGYSIPSWSPSGKKVVFNKFLVKKQDVRTQEEGMYLLDLEKNKLIKILNLNDYDTGQPVFYPTGKEVTFIGKPKGTGKYKTHSINIDTKNIKTISEAAKGINWSPDGREICYFSGDDNQVHIVNIDGTNDRAITDLKTYGWGSCAWSPDGKKIIFACSRSQLVSPPHEIYIINKDGTGLMRFYPKNKKWSSRISSPQWWAPKE